MTDIFNQAKKAVGEAALAYIQSGMKVGLGTGSTTRYFIDALGRSKLDIHGLATSKESELLAKKWGIPLLDPETADTLDITIDGADEIDGKWRLIKGGGGALLREKITASISKEAIYIVDESKVKKHLGSHPLPIEVLRWGKEGTRKILTELGFKGDFRPGFITDNGNVIYDITFDSPIEDPELLDHKLNQVPGVLATGLFFNLASKVLVGDKNGHVKTL
ncbi:MAG: ribose-5-phosphate isomerase RpiA [Chlamydiia bacterium]|nr:ribose-5-phosphate isomerase RpiA [Chlamydiia bacterium]